MTPRESMRYRAEREHACIRCGSLGFGHHKARLRAPAGDERRPVSLERPKWLGWPICRECESEMARAIVDALESKR